MEKEYNINNNIILEQITEGKYKMIAKSDLITVDFEEPWSRTTKIYAITPGNGPHIKAGEFMLDNHCLSKIEYGVSHYILYFD